MLAVTAATITCPCGIYPFRCTYHKPTWGPSEWPGIQVARVKDFAAYVWREDDFWCWQIRKRRTTFETGTQFETEAEAKTAAIKALERFLSHTNPRK